MSIAPLLVLLTCLVASVSYIGAVTQAALVTMVLPLVVAVGALACWMRAQPIAAVWTAVFVSGSGGEAVNVLSGNYQGSVARSAGAASLATGLALVASASRRPALFLVPVGGIIAWALALGAGARVELVAVVTAALGLLTLATVERDRRAFVTPPRLAGSVLLAFLLVVAAGVFAAQFQLRHDGRAAASPFRESLATTIEPPAILSLTRHPPPSATQTVPPPAPKVAAAEHRSRLPSLLNKLLWAFLALLALLAVALLTRVLWVALAWHRLRRRLQRRVIPPEAGAWAWVVATLERLGSPLPMHVSPDVAMAAEGDESDSLRDLARAVTSVVFNVPGAESSDVWNQAQEVADGAWNSSGRLRRIRAHWQGPRRAARAH